MIRTQGRIVFGFFENASYTTKSDKLQDFEKMQNSLTASTIIKHIESLDPAYSSEHSVDAYTGETFNTGVFHDGSFWFPVDVLRYLKAGKIGVPKEYEEYLISEVGPK